MKRTKIGLLLIMVLSPIAIPQTTQGAMAQVGQIDRQESPDKYRYDGASGTCRNGANEVGYNPFALAAVQGTKDAECLDLRGVELIELETGIESPLGYNKLLDWNFRGSNLDGAKFFFNHLILADLRGTQFSKLEFGYASITGYVDEFSAVAPHCDRVADFVDCRR